MSRLSYKSLLIILLFLLIPITLLFRINQKPTSTTAAGWPSTAGEWLKRKQLTLVNNSGATLSANTTYSLTLNTKALVDSGHLQSDCADIRVYYQPNDSTSTKLNYYLEYPGSLTCATSTTTTLHFPLQADLANSSTSPSYFLYYDNPQATSESSISAFDIGDKQATFYCGFNDTTDCVNQVGLTSPTTASGAIRYTSPSALSFDGFNDKIDLGSPNSLDNLLNNQKVTFESWIYLDSKKACHQYWFSTQRSSNQAGWWSYWGCGTETGTFTIYCGTQNAQSTPSSSLPQNQWFHYAVTYDDTGDRKIRIFVNGTEGSYSTQNECQGSVNDYSSYSHNIWGSEWSGASKNKGVLDEFRISSTVRYTSNFTPQTTPFVRDEFTKLLLHFDESGDDPRNTGKAIDDSGNDNHGTITGAKYVAGLVGVDSSTLDSGTLPTQSYAGHQGVFIEEGTTNKITNPSFENSTAYDTNWSVGAGATATANTTSPYYKFGSKSLKLVATSDTDATISIDTGSTATHTLSAYVYDGTTGNVGGTLASTTAQLIFNGVAVGTTYTDTGSGWWRLSVGATPASGSQNFGLQVKSGKTVYVDSFQLEQKTFFTSYTDGTLGIGYSWSNTAHESTSSRTAGTIQYATSSHINGTEGSLSIWQRITDNWTYSGTWNDYLISIGSNKLHIKYNPNCVGCNGQFSANYNQWWGVPSSAGGQIGANYGNGGRSYFTNDGWTHTVLTWKLNEFKWYRNGSLVGQDTIVTDITDFTGSIYLPDFIISSDLRVHDSALSTTEVASLYYSGLGSHQIQSGYTERFSDGEPSSAHWTLDEGTGTTIYDSISDYDGTLATGTSAPTWADSASCVSQNCLSFDGNDYATIATPITGLKTLSFWLKPTSATASIIDLNGSQTITLSGGTLSATNISSPTIYINGQATTTIATDTWSHVLITSTTSFATSSFTLGKVSSGFLTGYLDEIKVYPYVLSSDQIYKDYNIGKAVSFGHQSETAQVTPIKSKLIAHYKFDEGQGAIVHNNTADPDLSGQLGAGNSAPTWTNNGKIGKALSLDGNDYLSTTDNPAFDIGQSGFTYTAWINGNNFSSQSYNMFMGHYLPYFNVRNTGKLHMSLTDGTQRHVNGNTALNTGQWYHAAATYDSQGYMKVYLDGKLDGTSGPYSTLTNQNSDQYVGTWYNGRTYIFNGLIDEVKIYNHALTASEILQDYNLGMAAVLGQSGSNTGSTAPGGSASQEYCVPGDPSTCSPPVAEWQFDEGVGSTAYDTSGNSNHGVFGASDSSPTWTTGKIGKAVSFTSTDIITNDTVTYGDNFSFQAWINPTNLSPVETYGRTIAASSPSSGVYYPIWILVNNNQIRVYAYQTSPASYHTSTFSNIQTNNWYHIAITATRNSAGAKLYINGQLDSTFTPGNQAPNNYLSIGDLRTGRGIDFQGKIDQAKLYNYARTPAQIAWDYNRGKPIAHYRLDECQGTVAHSSADPASAGQGLDGTINADTIGTCSSSGAWYDGRTGKLSASLYFDGDADYVTVGDIGTSATSISFWIKPDSTTQSILEISATDSVAISSGTVSITGFGTETVYVDGLLTSTVPDTNWHHLTIVSSANIPANTVNIGKVSSTYYAGQIDDVQIFNYALTSDQVKTLYNNGAVSFTD